MNRRDPQDYRRKAAKAEAFADSINDPDMRVELRRLAESYRELADEEGERCPLDSGGLEPDRWR